MTEATYTPGVDAAMGFMNLPLALVIVTLGLIGAIWYWRNR